MRIGASFPQTEIGTDPGAIREWAQGVEALGFDYILAFDHVLGAHPDHPAIAGSRFHFTHESLVHEPLTLLAYFAALTRRVDLVTGIIILPQRQTALVAKQAAEIDVLSGGRLRLGVGLGWNPVEFEALGEQFENRAARIEEQVAVLRQLWTQELVTFKGRWHTITQAGINPLPVQRPIPIWFGATDDRAIARAGRIGDGWLAMGPPDAENARRVALLQTSAQAAGRDPASVNLIASLSIGRTSTPDQWTAGAAAWQALGASHLTISPARTDYHDVPSHLAALARVREVLSAGTREGQQG